MRPKCYKFAVLLSSKFSKHPAIKDIFAQRLQILNNKVNCSDDYFFTEELSDEEINKINQKYDAIYTRHTIIKEEHINLITIPIFSQHECPLCYVGHLNKKIIYLTDKSYIKYFPKAEIGIEQVVFQERINFNKRKYDIIFVGSNVAKNRPDTILFNIFKYYMNKYVNLTMSSDEIFDDLSFSSYLFRIVNRVMKKEKAYKLFWFLLHYLRYERRKKIIDEIYKLADKNHKICFITNENPKSKLPKHQNIYFKYDLKWFGGVSEYAKKSKFFIVQTPLHHSILNERFTSALENGCIPLCENYPQYTEILEEYSDKLVFNYDKFSLSTKIMVLQELSTQKSNLMLDTIKKRTERLKGADKFRARMFELVDKYG